MTIEPQELGEVRVSPGERERKAGQRRMLLVLGSALVLLMIVPFALRLVGVQRFDAHPRSSFSSRADGFLALSRVLERLGYRVERQRDSYGQLPPPGDTVLLMIDPIPAGVLQDTRMDDAQIRSLRRWLEDGGHLVAAPAGFQTVRALGMEITLDEEPPGRADALELLLDGQEFATLRVGTGGRMSGGSGLEGVTGFWQPVRDELASLVTAFVKAPGVEGRSGRPTMVAFTPDGHGEFTVGARLEEHPILLDRAMGLGHWWLLSSSLPFTNLALARQGTGNFLVRMLHRASDGGRRTIFFDEYSHGLRQRRGLLWMVWHTELAYPVAGLLLMTLLLSWRGGLRLGVPDPLRGTPRRAVEEFVVSLADLSLRAKRYRGAARGLLQSYGDRLQRLRGGSHDRHKPRELEAFARRLKLRGEFGEAELVEFSRQIAAAYHQAARSVPDRSQPEENHTEERT